MPLQAVDTRRLYRRRSARPTRRDRAIERGEYAAGARLPPERDLAKQLGVSRPSVREALIALEVEGYVEVRIGSGVYVWAPPHRPRADALVRGLRTVRAHQGALADRGRVRRARRQAGDPAQVRAMEEALDQMEGDRASAASMPLASDRLLPPAHRRGERQQRARAGGEDALGPAHRPALPAPRAPLRHARLCGRGDPRAPRDRGRDRAPRRRRRRRDAPPHGPRGQAIQQQLERKRHGVSQ